MTPHPQEISLAYLRAQTGHRVGSSLEIMPRRQVGFWRFVLPAMALVPWVLIALAAWVGTGQ